MTFNMEALNKRTDMTRGIPAIGSTRWVRLALDRESELRHLDARVWRHPITRHRDVDSRRT